MSLRDILQKKDKILDLEVSNDQQHATAIPPGPTSPVPEIRFVRSDTTSQDVVTPPRYDGDDEDNVNRDNTQDNEVSKENYHLNETTVTPETSPSRRSRLSVSASLQKLHIFHRSSQSFTADELSPTSPSRPQRERRLSHLLHRSSRNSSSASVNVPADLPQVDVGNDAQDEQDREAQWEKRATILIQGNPNFGVSPSSSVGNLAVETGGTRSRSSSAGHINDPQNDVR